MGSPRTNSKRRDFAAPTAADAWDGEVDRLGLPDSIEAIGEDWRWAESTAVFYRHHDIADPSVRRVLDNYTWRTMPAHGDSTEAFRAIYEVSAEAKRARPAQPSMQPDHLDNDPAE